MTYDALIKALNSWATSIIGRYIDLDGFPPSHPWQCHDVLLSMLVSIFGLPIGAGHAAGDGWTDEVWKQFPGYRPQLKEHFTKHYGVEGIRAGDVIFWPYGSRGYPWSHIAVAMGAVVNGRVQCVSQNPGATQLVWLDVSEALGYLRPIVAGAPGSGSYTPQKGKTVVVPLSYQDRKARLIQPGKHTWLRTKAQKLDSQAVNLVGQPGNYDFILHIYIEGLAPGDTFTTNLSRQSLKYAEPHKHASPHYYETMVANAAGVIQANVPFTLGTAPKDMIFAALKADAKNKKPGRVTVFDSDARLFL